jgi:hypothetical protein
VLLELLKLRKYQTNTTPYALQNKIELVQAVSKLAVPVDVRYELSPGREGGIVPLLKQAKIDVAESATTKIVFTDKLDGPVIIGDELGIDLSRVGGLRVVTSRLQ